MKIGVVLAALTLVGGGAVSYYCCGSCCSYTTEVPASAPVWSVDAQDISAFEINAAATNGASVLANAETTSVSCDQQSYVCPSQQSCTPVACSENKKTSSTPAVTATAVDAN